MRMTSSLTRDKGHTTARAICASVSGRCSLGAEESYILHVNAEDLLDFAVLEGAGNISKIPCNHRVAFVERNGLLRIGIAGGILDGANGGEGRPEVKFMWMMNSDVMRDSLRNWLVLLLGCLLQVPNGGGVLVSIKGESCRIHVGIERDTTDMDVSPLAGVNIHVLRRTEVEKLKMSKKRSILQHREQAQKIHTNCMSPTKE